MFDEQSAKSIHELLDNLAKYYDGDYLRTMSQNLGAISTVLQSAAEGLPPELFNKISQNLAEIDKTISANTKSISELVYLTRSNAENIQDYNQAFVNTGRSFNVFEQLIGKVVQENADSAQVQNQNSIALSRLISVIESQQKSIESLTNNQREIQSQIGQLALTLQSTRSGDNKIKKVA